MAYVVTSRRLGIGVALFLLAVPAHAAGWPEAEAAFSAQRWDEAVRGFERIVVADPKDAQAELRLATALLHVRRYEDATVHLDRAQALGIAPGALAYRRAALLALTGDPDAAFTQLDKALAGGMGPAAQPASEPLLAPLHADARFKPFLERYDRIVTPCRYDPRHRELDFWIGAWDVRQSGASPDSPAAENVVTLGYGDCVVQEHWRSLGGGTGSSFNIYDGSRKMWFQTWVDASGELHEYHGNLDGDGKMVFVGEVPGGAGQPACVPTRMTLTREGPDRVRQLSESSLDGGMTWSTNYDFIYTRRK